MYLLINTLKEKINFESLKYWLDFLFALTTKEIRGRYKQAIFGFFWVVLNPLFQMIVIGVIFQFFVPVKVDNYFLFLFSGLLPWGFFNMTVGRVTPIYVFERHLIQKAKFPREAIALSIVLSNFFHLLVSIALLLLFMLFSKQIHWSSIYFLPLALFWLLILTSGISLLFSSLNVRFRDINFMVQAVLPLWFYATPVIYTLDLLPTSLLWFYYLNPMSGVIELFRFSLLSVPINYELVIFWGIILTLVIGFFGALIFIRESPRFDDWL